VIIIDKIPSSKTLEINATAKRLISEGKDVVNLTAGEPDFPTPEPIIEAATDAMRKGYTKYTDSKGIIELREAISKMLSKRKIDYSADEILVTNGGKQGIFNAMMSMLDPGDEVILISPLWVSYVPQIMLTGAKPVIIKTSIDNNFVPDPDEIKKYISNKTKVILVNSPNNPTGAVYPYEIMKRIAELANKNNIKLISDEVYDRLVYTENYTSMAGLCNPENLVYINAFSKSHSMTGWRIGYMCTKDKTVYRRSTKLVSHITSNVSSISQYAALKATTVDTSYMLDEFRKRRTFVESELERLNLKHSRISGAFYAFFQVGTDDSKFCKDLLEKEMLALVPGSAFDAPGFARMSFASSLGNIEKGFKRLEHFLNRKK
jgi:aspartate aminotransferase